jgi:parvulin-like peptidyl-prolyl isomerase
MKKATSDAMSQRKPVARTKRGGATSQSLRAKPLNATQERAQQRSNRIAYFAVFLVAVLIIAGIVWYWTERTQQPYLVRVNGVPITESQLQFQYRLLPEEYRTIFTPEQVLEQIIDEELVVQAARARGILITDEDVNERVQEILGRNEIAPQDLEQNLAGLNITVEQFESLIRRQLLIDRFRDMMIETTMPTTEELKVLYDLDKQRFEVGEQVTARHVLISMQRTDSALIAKQIYDDVLAGKDFCELVLNASDDRGSRDRCGEYTFPRGYMVPEFEQASFDMKPGDVRMIQTQFGYHIIQKLKDIPASTTPFEAVESDLRDEYVSTGRAVQYRRVISDLRSSATLVYQNGTTVLPQSAGSVASAGAAVIETQVLPTEDALPSDELVKEAPADEQVVVNDEPAAEVPVAVEAPVAETPVATPVVEEQPVVDVAEVPAIEAPVGETPLVEPPVAEFPAEPAVEAPVAEAPVVEPVAPVAAPADEPSAPYPRTEGEELFACIAGRSRLYGATWSTETKDAIALFAQYNVDLPYVACDQTPSECRTIEAYPTWTIKGWRYVGRMTVDELKAASDC